MVIDHCICIKSMFSLQFLFCPQSWKSCPQFRKSEEGRQKWPILAAKKVGMSANFFLFSLNPYWHGLYAKNGVQIGQILLLWPHLYFTSAYRGSPPCTLSHYPDNRETGYSNVLGVASIELLKNSLSFLSFSLSRSGYPQQSLFGWSVILVGEEILICWN